MAIFFHLLGNISASRIFWKENRKENMALNKIHLSLPEREPGMR
jgi:hypothetical protein